MFSENSYFCRTFALYIKKNYASNEYEQNICLKNVPKNEKLLETQEVQFYGQLTRRGSWWPLSLLVVCWFEKYLWWFFFATTCKK